MAAEDLGGRVTHAHRPTEALVPGRTEGGLIE